MVGLSVQKMSYRGALISLCFPPALSLSAGDKPRDWNKYKIQIWATQYKKTEESGLLKPVRFGSSQRNQSPWRAAGMWMNWGHQKKISWSWENETASWRWRRVRHAWVKEWMGVRLPPLRCPWGFSFSCSPLLPTSSLTCPGGNPDMAGISWTTTSWCHACGTLGRPLRL